jgi:hypothetical protein
MGYGEMRGFFYLQRTRSLPLPVLISLRELIYLLFVQSFLMPLKFGRSGVTQKLSGWEGGHAPALDFVLTLE